MWLQVLGITPVGIASLVGFRKWRRRRPRRCPQCQTRMTRLDEVADDEHLNKGQLAEERVGSVDYDVWRCPSCAHHFTLRYPKWLSQYESCPQCHNRTLHSTTVTLEAATTSREGTAQGDRDLRVLHVQERIHEDPAAHLGIVLLIRRGKFRSSSFGGGSSGGGGASRSY